MKCPECGREFFEGKFCPDCGTLVNSDYVRQNQSNSSSISEEIKKCRDCGHALKETDKFCPNCGANSHLNKEDSRKIKINWGNISNSKGGANSSKSKVGSNSSKSTVNEGSSKSTMNAGSSKSTMNTGFSTSADNKNQGKSSLGFKDTFNNSSTVKKFFILLAVCCVGIMVLSAIGSFLFPDSNTSTYSDSDYSSGENDKFKFDHENRYGSDSSSSSSSSSRSSSSSSSASSDTYRNDLQTDESTDEYKDAYWDGYYGYTGVGDEDDDYYWDAYWDGYFDARS